MPGQRRRPAGHDPSARLRRIGRIRSLAPRPDGLAGSPFRALAIVTIALLCLSPLASIAGLFAVPAASASAAGGAAITSDESVEESGEEQAIPAAAGAVYKLPFPAGQTWTVGQSYNTSPSTGGTHWNCNPTTLKDAPSGTTGCRAHYQYKFSLDLYMADGSTAGRPVLSPVNGVIRWIDEAYGGMSIDLGNGYAAAFFHANLVGGLAAGQAVTQGQQLGTVSPPGGGGNGGWPHIHVTIWQTTDGGNWSRNAIPFTDTYA